MKIVSLLPSATEIVCSLGLQDNLVGVSHECDYPPGVADLPSVTKTIIPKGLSSIEIDIRVREHLQTEKALYALDMSTLQKLQPDLIVTQALCDVCAVAASEVNEAVCELPGNPQVVNLEPMSLGDVLATIALLAKKTNKVPQGQRTLANLNARIENVTKRSAAIHTEKRPRVGFFEWIDPLFNAGHWTPELIAMAGGIDCFGNLHQPSQTVEPSRLIEADPDILFIALCGFEEERTRQDLTILSEKIEGWDSLRCVKNGELYFTDGNAYFSRPGPRLVDSLEIMANCLHPELHPIPEHLKPATNFSGLIAPQ